MILYEYGDNMNYKKVFKRETKVIAIVVICMAIVVISGSYALFFRVKHNENNQVVQAGGLVITYKDGNTIMVDENDDDNCLVPQSDTKGVEKGCLFRFSITNDTEEGSTLPMKYNLLLYNDQESLNKVNSSGVFVDHKWIHYSLTKQNSKSDTPVKVTENPLVVGNRGTYVNDEGVDTGKRILEDESSAIIQSGETYEYSLRIWIDVNAPVDIINQYVYLKLDVTGKVYETSKAASETLTYSLDKSGLKELTGKSSALDSAGANSIKEYRYTGGNPNNYVTFNNESWRILGIYQVENESRIKLIKATGENGAWDTNNSLDFNTSSVNAYLKNYYDSMEASSKELIASTNYKLGGTDALSVGSTGMYDSEVSSNGVDGFIGLMSVSDYAFASGLSDDLIESDVFKTSTNWLNSNEAEWFINKNATGVYARGKDGSIGTDSTNAQKVVRPTVYLDSSVKILSGDGTESNPYVFTK